MTRLLHQPLVHFFALGGALFLLFLWTDDNASVADREVIAVTEQDVRWLSGQFEATWRRPPTEQELDGLISEYIREEVYVREALELGLHHGDAIVRRRLRQKMEFLTEAGAEAAALDDAVLEVFLAENADDFALAPRVAFTQILLPADDAETVEAILAMLTAGADPGELGRPTLLPARVSMSAPQAVDGAFGTGVFETIATLPIGVWSGPVTSGYGAHLVRLDAREAGTLPPLAEIRDRVEVAWRADKAAELRAARFEALQAKYKIERSVDATDGQ